MNQVQSQAHTKKRMLKLKILENKKNIVLKGEV